MCSVVESMFRALTCAAALLLSWPIVASHQLCVHMCAVVFVLRLRRVGSSCLTINEMRHDEGINLGARGMRNSITRNFELDFR